MKRWLPLIITAVLAALVLACFTLEKTSQDRGFSSEAWLNPWLASGRLLEMRGMNVRFTPEYSHLPPHARVIVLATPLELLEAQEQQKLLGWVRNGGHLVTEMQSVSAEGEAIDKDDVLQKQLDIRLLEHEDDDATRAALAKRQGLNTVTIAREGSLQVDFDRGYLLMPGKLAPEWRVTDDSGAHALRFKLGDGHITVLSDLAWMGNRQLARGDHGALLWRVVTADATTTASPRRSANNEVWLVHGQERPSLFSLLWKSAAPLIIAVTVFVLAWLWQSVQRFGPPRERLPVSRRRLTEHLEASGRYLLRQQAISGLFEASRQRLLAQVQRHYPQWRRLPAERLAGHLAARAGIENGAVLRLLNTPASDNLLQFAADIRLINRLRKAL